MADQIFSVDFDAAKFIQNVQQATSSLEGLEEGTEAYAKTLQQLQQVVNGVTFSKPIKGLMELKQVLKDIPKENLKGYFEQSDAAIEEFVQDADKVEAFLNNLKNEITTISDKEDFTFLADVIGKVENQLKSLRGETQNSENQNKSAKARLRELRAEMIKLEDAGLDGTAMFRKMEMESARLTDQLGDQAEKIRVLASDTFAMDATVDTLQNVAAGWQVLEGVTALAGQNNEEVMKSIQRLTAIMNIANGLQQINNFLTGQSAGKIALQKFWTDAQALSTRALTVATNSSAVAVKGLSAAIAGTGIGAIIIAIGFLVNELLDWIDTTKEAEEAQKKLNDELARGNTLFELNTNSIKRASDKRIADLKRAGADDLKIKQEELLRDGDLLKAKKENYAAQAEAFEKYKTDLKPEEFVKQQDDLLKKQQEILNDESALYVKASELVADDNKDRKEKGKKKVEDQKKIDDELKKLRDDYLKSLIDYRNKLADAQAEGSPLSPAKIKARFDREFAAEKQELNTKYAKLTKTEREQIIAVAKQINEVRRIQSVDEFKKSQAEARKEIEKLISSNANKIAEAKVAAIQDEYQRERESILLQEQQNIDSINETRDDQLDQLQSDFDAGFIASSKELINKRFIIEKQAEENIALVKADARSKEIEAVRAQYARQVEVIEEYAKNVAAAQSRVVSERILAESELLAKGEISREEYEKRIGKIEEAGRKERLQSEIDFSEKKIAELKRQLKSETDERKKALIQQQIDITQATVNAARTALNTGKKELKGADALIGQIFGVEDVEDVEAIKKSVNEVIQEGIDLLREQAAAEVEAADAAIAAQQKRVDEAAKIAAEGNAEYLQQEEDRLKALEAKREAAARRQLAIDSALQASQILVAVAGAAAQVARAEGVVGVVAGVAAIVAALASAAGLIQNIQNQQPKLFKGTDYVGRVDLTGGSDRVPRGTYAVGRDTIPAWLHEGEAVIQADKNKKYAPTVQAIRRGILPPEVLNSFVRNYSTNINYGRISDARKDHHTEVHVDMSGMESRMKNVELQLMQTNEYLQGLNVNVNLDQNGFAASIDTYHKKLNKIKYA